MSVVKKPNYWPLLIITVLDLIAVAVMSQYTSQRQDFILSVISIQVIAGFLAFLWFLFFSRLPGKVRLTGTGAVLALGLLAVATLRVDDYSGDIIPIPTWRWKPKADETLASERKTGDLEEIDQATYTFPGFLGPNGNGKTPILNLARDWKTNPPKEKWRQKIGAGWSGFAATDTLAITQEQRGEEEMVTCYSLEDGGLIWSHGDKIRFTSSLGGDGPRSTPSLSNGKVYTFGATGLLNCLSLATGEKIWSVDTVKKYGAVSPAWGFSCSPLVTKKLVVVSIGGSKNRSMIALDKETGVFVWGGGKDAVGYSSPQLRTLAGVPQILILNANTVAGHNPATGVILWEKPWGQGKPNVANPLLIGQDKLLVSSGYGVGAKLYSFTSEGNKVRATETYESRRLKAKFANYVQYKDAVYGLDDGVLTCIDPNDGSRLWKSGRYGHGQILLAGDSLLVQSESGSLHLVDPNPNELIELGEIPVLGNKSWNNMAISGNKLLMRNHKEAVCLELPVL